MIKKAQAIVYKYVNEKMHCLCLKRCPADGDFWHVMTGTLEEGEDEIEALCREVREELGEQKVISISPRLKTWVWKKGNDDVDMYDYAICLEDGKISLNEEHTEFVWLKPSEAFEKYKYESAKEMIGLLEEYLAKGI